MSTSKRRSMYSDAFGEFESKLIENAGRISSKNDKPEEPAMKTEEKNIPIIENKIVEPSTLRNIDRDDEEKIRGTRPVRMVSVMVENPETGEVYYEKRKKENKTSQITILVTGTENKLIRAKAKENGVTLNQYLRDIILRHIETK